MKAEFKKTLETEAEDAEDHGINRGIFGVPSAKKAEVEGLVKQLESQNPTPDPTVNLEKHNYNSRLKKNKAGIEGLHLIGRLKAKAARFKQFSFSSGTMKSDNGFKPGTFVQIEKLLEQKLPGSGIKASPHIESRVKTLKKQYNAITDMIVTSSGFSWNDEKKMIICKKDLYDGWVKSHPAAKGMWMKPFSHFDNLGNVFGKDHANGKQAANATDYIDEIDLNNDGLEEIAEMMTTPPPVAPVAVEGQNEAPRNRKRKRTYAYVLGLTQMVGAMSKTTEAMDKLVGSLVEFDPMRQVYDKVSKVEGLSTLSKLKVSQIIMANPVKVSLLLSLPEDVKKEWVEELLQ
ncbi:PREDICTED: uncharacterized protein LOC101304244 [Fragaria vesca subsp. vesca]